MKSEILTRLTKLEGSRPNDLDMLLVACGEGYHQKSTGRVFSRAEAEDLEARGRAVLVEFKVVYGDRTQQEETSE
jgi:hypothetical protein